MGVVAGVASHGTFFRKLAAFIKKRQQAGKAFFTWCNVYGVGIALVHFFLRHAGGIMTGDAQALCHRLIIIGIYFSGPQKASVGAVHHVAAAAQPGFGGQLV